MCASLVSSVGVGGCCFARTARPPRTAECGQTGAVCRWPGPLHPPLRAAADAACGRAPGPACTARCTGATCARPRCCWTVARSCPCSTTGCAAGPLEAARAPAAARGGVGSLRALARACKGGLPLTMRAPRCEARGSPKPEGFLVQGRTPPDLLSAASKRVARA